MATVLAMLLSFSSGHLEEERSSETVTQEIELTSNREVSQDCPAESDSVSPVYAHRSVNLPCQSAGQQGLDFRTSERQALNGLGTHLRI